MNQLFYSNLHSVKLQVVYCGVANCQGHDGVSGSHGGKISEYDYTILGQLI